MESSTKDVHTSEPEVRSSVGIAGTLHTYGTAPEIPYEKFRSDLCKCCVCPHAIMAWIFPFIIWAQVFKALHGPDPKKGMQGYFGIIGGFSFMIFIAACIRSTQLAWFITLASVIVMTSLLRRMRKVYDIKSKLCCCNEGCDDLCTVVFCHCCVTFQMGNHLFDYSKNTQMTFEPDPTQFVV